MSGDSEALEHAKALRDSLRWALGVVRGVNAVHLAAELRKAEDALLAFGDRFGLGGDARSEQAMMDRDQGQGHEGAVEPDEPAATVVDYPTLPLVIQHGFNSDEAHMYGWKDKNGLTPLGKMAAGLVREWIAVHFGDLGVDPDDAADFERWAERERSRAREAGAGLMNRPPRIEASAEDLAGVPAIEVNPCTHSRTTIEGDRAIAASSRICLDCDMPVRGDPPRLWGKEERPKWWDSCEIVKNGFAPPADDRLELKPERGHINPKEPEHG